MRRAAVLIASAVAGLAGCTSLSGLDADNDFSCKAAPGVTCQSISGVHQNASAGNLPFQRQAAEAERGPIGHGESDDARAKPYQGEMERAPKVSPRNMGAAYSGVPVRQPPLVLRVWMAPYEDEAGDLHDQSYFYTMVHSGQWMIEANRSAISGQFRPTFPLVQPGKPADAPQDRQSQRLMQKQEYEHLVDKPDVK